MDHSKIHFRDTRTFSPFFIDYIEQSPSLVEFFNRFPSINNFQDQIKEKGKSYKAETRKKLTSVLHEQYKNLETSEGVKNNLKLLDKENTFTITTGHQLNIFTGPLYFIYKIVTVINACKQLHQAYPKCNFIPVYWMASEDHDFEEISYFKLYSKKYVWKTDQKGAVGRFNPTSLKDVISALPGDVDIFKEAYLKHNTLSDAVRFYVNRLFGEEGLIVLDADNNALKGELKHVMEDDLFKHSSKQKVEDTNSKLQQAGYSTQVHAREINFFYLDKGLRSRIERLNNEFVVIDTDIKFSEKEIRNLIETEPIKFSPNVILRPLYQELILPNLAYVGGPAEVIYWLQLKSVFDHFNTPFPMLMPRNFGMVMSGPISRKFDKAGLTIKDLFEEKNFLFNDWVLKNTHHNLTVGQEIKKSEAIFDDLKTRAKEIDVTLEPLLSAEGKRALNSLEKIEKKMLKAEKRLHNDGLRQIDEIKEALFPNGGLQERSDNFLNFFQQDSEFIKKIIEHFDPFDYQFNVLRYPHS